MRAAASAAWISKRRLPWFALLLTLASACRSSTTTELRYRSFELTAIGDGVVVEPELPALRRSADGGGAVLHADYGSRLVYRSEWGLENIDIGFRTLVASASEGGLDLELDGEPIVSAAERAWIHASVLGEVDSHHFAQECAEAAVDVAGKVLVGGVYALAHGGYGR